MPNYYLTYVETADHSALMLSTQDNPPKGPTKIVYQIGFWPEQAYAEEKSILKKNAGKWQGVLKEEMMASKAIYSQQDVKHRTYQISEQEAERFYQIINRDKKRYREPQSQTVQDVQNGQNYQYIGYNCKAYTMDVFNQLGLIETQDLMNLTIQRPGSREALQDLSNEQIRCPLKDNFILENNKILNELDKQLDFLSQNQEAIISSLKNKESQKNFSAVLKLMKENADIIKANMNKVGFDDVVDGEYAKLVSNMNYLSDYLSEIEKGPFQETVEEIKQQQEAMEEQFEVLTRIKKEYKNNTLEYEWITPPPVAERVQLENFTQAQRMAILIDVRKREMLGHFDQIEKLLTEKLKDKNLPPALREDLTHLKGIISEAKKTLDPIKLSEYRAKAENQDPKELLKHYEDQYKKLDKVMDDLQNKVDSFKPKSKTESNKYVGLIRKMIHFFQKDYKILSSDPKSVLQKDISALSKKQAKRKESFNVLYRANEKPKEGKKETLPRKHKRPGK